MSYKRIKKEHSILESWFCFPQSTLTDYISVIKAFAFYIKKIPKTILISNIVSAMFSSGNYIEALLLIEI